MTLIKIKLNEYLKRKVQYESFDFFMQELHVHPKATKGDTNQLGAPMPGEVIDIRVKVGDTVEKGAPLVVLSAMKMEMVVQAPRAGKIKSLEINMGMRLEGEDLVLTFE